MVKLTWLATGNNIQLGGDLPRRCIWCRLDARMARPWKRSGFRHEDLPGWVTCNRSRLLGAILTLVAAWFTKGRPQPATPVLGGFQEWAGVIGGILQVAGIEGFLENLDQFYEQSDAEATQWEAFLGAWQDRYRQESRTVSELTEDMKREQSSQEAPPGLLTFCRKTWLIPLKNLRASSAS